MWQYLLGFFTFYILSFLGTVLFGRYPGNPMGGGY